MQRALDRAVGGTEAPGAATRKHVIERLQDYFASYRFPAGMLALLGAFELFLLVILAVPNSHPAVGAFAEEFRTWCFGWDPATGGYTVMYVVIMLGQPLALGALILFVWWQPLAIWWRRGLRARLPYLVSANALVFLVALLLFAMRSEASSGELPFPAERLRTAYAVPALELEDQNGARVTLEDHAGKVVVVTGVYTRCGHTCPLIVAELERALSSLTEEERRDVALLLITLHPARHDRLARKALEARHGFAAPPWYVLGGAPDRVNNLLDRFQIARTRGPMPDVIEHANLFLVIDRAGRLAYRFTLGERQERWLQAALRGLLLEPGRGAS